MKINSVLSVFLASLAIGASIASAPASAQNLGQGFIRNVSYNKCLDFAAGNLSNAVTLQLQNCGGNNAINQQWNFIPAGSYPNGAASYSFPERHELHLRGGRERLPVERRQDRPAPLRCEQPEPALDPDGQWCSQHQDALAKRPQRKVPRRLDQRQRHRASAVHLRKLQ